jgi:Rhodopirellula transposase DDE domain
MWLYRGCVNLKSGCKAIPYGVYDVGANTGWVGVGVDHNTAAFAVHALRRWWQQVGRLWPVDGWRGRW